MISLSKDFKHGHKLWSVWCAAGVVILSAMEMASQMGMGIAPLWKEIIPDDKYPVVVAALSSLGIAARFIRQTCLTVKEELHNDDQAA